MVALFGSNKIVDCRMRYKQRDFWQRPTNKNKWDKSGTIGSGQGSQHVHHPLEKKTHLYLTFHFSKLHCIALHCHIVIKLQLFQLSPSEDAD